MYNDGGAKEAPMTLRSVDEMTISRKKELIKIALSVVDLVEAAGVERRTSEGCFIRRIVETVWNPD